MDCPDLFTYFPKKKKSLISLPVQTAIQPWFNAVVLDFYEIRNYLTESACQIKQLKSACFHRRRAFNAEPQKQLNFTILENA